MQKSSRFQLFFYYYESSPDSDSEIRSKIGQYLMKSRRTIQSVAVFWAALYSCCFFPIFRVWNAPYRNSARLRRTYNVAADRAICADCWILRTLTTTGRNADKLTHWRADAVTSNKAAPCYCCKSICGCSWLFVTALDLRAGAALLWHQCCCIPRYASWL